MRTIRNAVNLQINIELRNKTMSLILPDLPCNLVLNCLSVINQRSRSEEQIDILHFENQVQELFGLNNIQWEPPDLTELDDNAEQRPVLEFSLDKLDEVVDKFKHTPGDIGSLTKAPKIEAQPSQKLEAIDLIDTVDVKCEVSVADETEVLDQKVTKIRNKGKKKVQKSQSVKPAKAKTSNDDLPLKSLINIRRFSCEFCTKSFKLKHQLQNHLLIHLQIKKFTCDKCGKSFRQLGHLKKHSEEIHGIGATNEMYMCSECGKEFLSMRKLKYHTDNTHNGKFKKKIGCQHCKKFFSRGKLKDHVMKEHEKNFPHSCKECKKGFVQLYYLQRHVKQVHSKNS